MANALYPKSKAKFQRGQIDMNTVSVKAALLDQATYTYNAAHEFMSSITGIVARTRALTGKAVNMTTGAFDSDDPTAEAVTEATSTGWCSTWTPARTLRVLSSCSRTPASRPSPSFRTAATFASWSMRRDGSSCREDQ
jgi:hypothetical protein